MDKFDCFLCGRPIIYGECLECEFEWLNDMAHRIKQELDSSQEENAELREALKRFGVVRK